MQLTSPTIAYRPAKFAGGTLPRRPEKGKYQVVIVGNGIGGVAAGRELNRLLGQRKDLADIIIIGKSDRFVYKPMLPDALNHDVGSLPMADVFRAGSHVAFKQAEVTGFSVDTNDKFVQTSNGNIPFDYLIYAPGATTNYFNIQGAKEHAMPLEEEGNLETIRQTAVKKLEEAVDADYNSTDQYQNLSFVIVGAGATGVELAFELKIYMDEVIQERFPKLAARRPQITIVEASGDILPGFSPEGKAYVKRRFAEEGIELILNAMVMGVTEDGILRVKNTTEGEEREYNIHTIAPMWVTGIKANPLNDTLPFNKVGHKDQLEVTVNLEIPKRPDVYAIGDAVATLDSERQVLPDTGQVAEQSGKYVAQDLYQKLVTGKISPKRKSFKYKSKGVMLSTGPIQGLLRVMDMFTITGCIASKIRQWVYHQKLHRG